MTAAPLVPIPAAEVPRLREAMRDVQMHVSSFYAETARTGEELGRWVRAFLASAQVVNDLLTNESSQLAAYAALFTARTDAGVDLIDAMKYARNVDQHVFHIVEPGKERALIGGLHSMRTYELWDEVPQSAHDDLRKGTQALKPFYDSAMKGKSVTDAMLAVLRFYAALDPQIVHRDDRGEWTGFPLADQPGVSSPLHPEEPLDSVAAMAWLNARRPNGDARVVCAQVTHHEIRYLCGMTFANRRSFSPFAETVAQVERDVAAGMPYLIGEVAANVENVSARFPRAAGGVFFSRAEVTSWATPVDNLESDADWHSYFDANAWQSVVRLDSAGPTDDVPGYLVRRARRLNAYQVPMSG